MSSSHNQAPPAYLDPSVEMFSVDETIRVWYPHLQKIKDNNEELEKYINEFISFHGDIDKYSGLYKEEGITVRLTLLSVAILINSSILVKKLIDKGVDVNKPIINNSGKAIGWPLCTAIWSGRGSADAYEQLRSDNVDIVKMLINAPDTDVNIQCIDGKRPLHVACSRCTDEGNHVVAAYTVKELIEAGADVNLTDNNGNLPIYSLANVLDEPRLDLRRKSVISIAQTLIIAGSNVYDDVYRPHGTPEGPHGTKSLVHIFAEYGLPEIVFPLIQVGAYTSKVNDEYNDIMKALNAELEARLSFTSVDPDRVPGDQASKIFTKCITYLKHAKEYYYNQCPYEYPTVLPDGTCLNDRTEVWSARFGGKYLHNNKQHDVEHAAADFKEREAAAAFKERVKQTPPQPVLHGWAPSSKHGQQLVLKPVLQVIAGDTPATRRVSMTFENNTTDLTFDVRFYHAGKLSDRSFMDLGPGKTSRPVSSYVNTSWHAQAYDHNGRSHSFDWKLAKQDGAQQTIRIIEEESWVPASSAAASSAAASSAAASSASASSAAASSGDDDWTDFTSAEEITPVTPVDDGVADLDAFFDTSKLGGAPRLSKRKKNKKKNKNKLRKTVKRSRKISIKKSKKNKIKRK